jgi:hypothetical protein
MTGILALGIGIGILLGGLLAVVVWSLCAMCARGDDEAGER